MPDWDPSDQFEDWGGCGACRHYRAGTKCVAYPKGILFPIMSGVVDHMGVRPRQTGKIVFEWSKEFRPGAKAAAQ